jgi:hypothetical protein
MPKYNRSMRASAIVTPDPVMSRERAEQFGRRVALHCELGRFDLARAVIVSAEQEILAERRERAARRRRTPATIPVAELERMGVGLRELNYLDERGIGSLEQLLHCRRDELDAIPGMGALLIDRICAAARRLLAECFFGRLPPRYRLLDF